MFDKELAKFLETSTAKTPAQPNEGTTRDWVLDLGEKDVKHVTGGSYIRQREVFGV